MAFCRYFSDWFILRHILIHSLNDYGKAAGSDKFSKAFCGEAIKLADVVSAWSDARDAACRRASASKLARRDGR